MEITKEQIIEVLNGYAYQQKSCELDKFVIDADFSSVADEILTLLQSNDAGQPNGSKPIVSRSKCDYHAVFTFCGDNGITYCSNCGDTV